MGNGPLTDNLKQHIRDLNARYRRQANLADIVVNKAEAFLEAAPVLYQGAEYRKARKELLAALEEYDAG